MTGLGDLHEAERGARQALYRIYISPYLSLGAAQQAIDEYATRVEARVRAELEEFFDVTF